MKKFIAAFRFLTVIPVPGESSEKELAESLCYFPVVGIVIGLLAATSGWVLYGLFPPVVATVTVVFFLMAITGGFHLDGLADCADGFFSARPKEKILEIMRDSRVGVMGVLAIVFVLFFKVAALIEIGPDKACAALFLMPVAARCVMVVKMALFSYVRDQGIGKVFLKDRTHFKTASYISLGVLYSACWFAAGLNGLFAGAVCLVGTGLFAFFCKLKIGGITGDTLGAASEVAETLMAIALAQVLAG